MKIYCDVCDNTVPIIDGYLDCGHYPDVHYDDEMLADMEDEDPDQFDDLYDETYKELNFED